MLKEARGAYDGTQCKTDSVTKFLRTKVPIRQNDFGTNKLMVNETRTAVLRL